MSDDRVEQTVDALITQDTELLSEEWYKDDRMSFKINQDEPVEEFTGKPSTYLLEEEKSVINLAGRLWNEICKAVPDGPARKDDLRELMFHIHAIQRAMMANAAARAYPHLYRSLGGPDDDLGEEG